MALPSSPIGWAIHLSEMLKAFQAAHGLNRFPVDVEAIAREYSKKVFPSEPITLVEGISSKEFEGMLLPNPNGTGEWGILYNDSLKSKGRQNFTLAHELGHYLLHRHKSPSGIKCENRDMMDWKSDAAQIEAQANTFASYLLMPLDDFREQTNVRDFSLELFIQLADRYEVSVTAAILKWLSITHKRAMIVVGKDGFIDWAWSSPELIRSGIYYKPRQITTELPSMSLAARRDMSQNNLKGVVHKKGIWKGNEEVLEMTIFTSDYNNLSVSLLIYPDISPKQLSYEEEPMVLDTYEKFASLK